MDVSTEQIIVDYTIFVYGDLFDKTFHQYFALFKDLTAKNLSDL